ncbi:hypothetical protein [uncultured Sunxiuqinia sp.]|uniref:hypothetical protein n=1 Tax=uncultured Sunxiuqinia sp. TaxID=1573825 RepID=UPI002AA83726|nr:hypothetical protein [uncultured Sunxiuqinia sp.]
MKRIAVLCLILGSILTQTMAAEPFREPFIQLFIDGKLMESGSDFEVNKGDQFTLLAQLKGGRSDFVWYPDTYFDFSSDTKIISKGNKKIVYQEGDQVKTWELLSENVEFESDNKIKLEIVQELANKQVVEVTIPAGNIEKSYIKVTIVSTWQFTEGDTTRLEENTADAIIHLDINGNENEWFATPNIKASGFKSNSIEDELKGIQSSFDKIEDLLTNFDFPSVQAEIRNLQSLMRELETQVRKIEAETPTNATDIYFKGTPSDEVIKDISSFKELAEDWNELETIIEEQADELNKLEQSGDKIKRRDLLSLIKPLIKWQESLPSNAESLLNTYTKDIDWTDVIVQSALSFDPEKDRINKLDLAMNDFKEFLSRRTQQIQVEKKKINYASTRLQAVKIFDGMLLGYFSSINFAKWENTRE